MSTIKMDDMRKYLEAFTNAYHADPRGRYQSYDHCRRCFIDHLDNEEAYDLIALNLYAYLASWGMLRNSFLMQKDYLFHRPVIDVLAKPKYRQLLSFNPFIDSAERYVEDVLALKHEIVSCYKGKEYFKDDTGEPVIVANVTDTLVTKIILGTLGCVPAYDQYLVKALRMKGIVGTFGRASLYGIIEFAKKNRSEIEKICAELGELYTPMKIIDMYFWELGMRVNDSK